MMQKGGNSPVNMGEKKKTNEKKIAKQDKQVKTMIIWALEKIAQKRFGDDLKRWEMWVYAPDRLN